MEAEIKPENTGEKQEIQEPTRDDKGRFVPGCSGNPKGKEPGKKNYETYMNEAIEEYAKLNGMTADQVKVLIYKRGIKEALEGDFQFFKDFMDRTHGKPLQRFQGDLDVGVKTLEDLLKEDDEKIDIENETEKNEPTTNRGTTEDTQQERTASAVQTECSPEILPGKEDEKKPDTESTPEGNQ